MQTVISKKVQREKPGISFEIIVLSAADFEYPPYILLGRDGFLVRAAGEGVVLTGSAVHRGLYGPGRARNEPRQRRRRAGARLRA